MTDLQIPIMLPLPASVVVRFSRLNRLSTLHRRSDCAGRQRLPETGIVWPSLLLWRVLVWFRRRGSIEESTGYSMFPLAHRSREAGPVGRSHAANRRFL